MRTLMRTVLLLFVSGSLFIGTAQATTISLDGDWKFVADPTATLDVQKLATAEHVLPTSVPSSWQSQFADLRDYAGVAWYWRSVDLQPPAHDQVALLRFGAVDYLAEVYVNGQKAGSHEGGYLPFEFDITSLLRSGENQIAVRIVDPGAKPNNVVEGIDYAEIPHGKQNWYVQTSGLWQSVELELRPRVHLGDVHIRAGADGTFKIDVPIVNAAPDVRTGAPVIAKAAIFDPANKQVWQRTSNLASGQEQVPFSGSLTSPALWSPSNPKLYRLAISLSSGDSESIKFGFRTFETRGGKFYLNGTPIYLRGALDQDFYPETIYTPPSLDYIRDEMRKAKALGLNLLRCHIKVPDPRYFEAADEVGILVWYEIPNWERLTAKSKHRATETLQGMVARDWNHPSIVMISIINESWGADLKDAGNRQWLKQMYQKAKVLVPGWMVDDNSACCENFHMETDVADYHTYSAVPDYAANFDRVVDDLARRPRWLFSPYGDATPKGDEPLLLSEFGNWGLPHVPEKRPWWFSRDFEGREITRPTGLEKRFSDYQFNSLFADLKDLISAAQWHEYRALKYEIGSLRSLSDIQGYVITEYTDLNWEANGLLSMWRQPKIFADSLSRLQKDDLLILRMDRRNFFTGETAKANVYFSHYSAEGLDNVSVTWRVEGTPLEGSFPLPAVSTSTAAKVGSIEFVVPASSAPEKRVLRAWLVKGGASIAEESLDVYFYPPEQPTLPPPVSFHDPDGRLRRLVNEMHARGYLAPTGSETYPVLITSTFDDQVKSKLRDGGRVILMGSDKETLAPGIEIVPRSDDALSGNWISNFLWLRKEQSPFKGIGFNTMGEFETQAVTPPAVVKGIPPQNFNDVLAGMFYGWIHSNVGVLVQAKAGKGKLLICTFSLGTTYNSDPYASYLLDALVNYAASDFTPHFEIPM